MMTNVLKKNKKSLVKVEKVGVHLGTEISNIDLSQSIQMKTYQ